MFYIREKLDRSQQIDSIDPNTKQLKKINLLWRKTLKVEDKFNRNVKEALKIESLYDFAITQST